MDLGKLCRIQDSGLPKMNNLDWGKTTEERNENIARYDALQTDEERRKFLMQLKYAIRDSSARKTLIYKISDASSSELKQQIMAMGLDPTGKSVKDMEMMLGMAIFAKNNPGKEFPDQFDPMLAEDSTMADKDWIDKVFNAKDYIIEEKENGMRSIFSLKPTGDIVMTSRSRSVKDYMFVPHQDYVLGFQNIKSPFKGKTVLDGELKAPVSEMTLPSGITTTSPLQAIVALVHMRVPESLKLQEKYGSIYYKAYDCLFFEGEDVQNLPYEKRTVLTSTAVSMLREANPDMPISMVRQIMDYDSAYAIYQEFIENGAEGVMLKRRKGIYEQGKRSNDLQKLKGYVTVDGFITGMVKSDPSKGKANLIGGFRISAYVNGKLKEIAAVSNIPDDVRKAATIQGENGPELNPEYLDKCVELVGQEFSAQSNRLGSARINEWRPDKLPSDCNVDPALFEGKKWK